MKQRCCNPNSRWYHRYGGRGITVWPAWAASFDAFLADMGRRPSAEHSLDRIDNKKGYEPGNVRWATPKEQNRNQRSNRLLTIEGEAKTIAEWAEQTGLSKRTIQYRVSHGWTPEAAVLTPPR